MTVSFPSVSNLDKIASFIGSDFKHVQECKYICSWQLGPVLLAGEVWKGDFLDWITLVVSWWNVCLQEQKVAEWRAVTCLVTINPSHSNTNTPLTESLEITKKISSGKQKAISFVADLEKSTLPSLHIFVKSWSRDLLNLCSTK